MNIGLRIFLGYFLIVALAGLLVMQVFVQQVKPGATLLQALAQAGGVSPFAAKKRIQLRRVDKNGNEKVYKFDLDAIERGESGGGATRLMGGDVIVIPQRKLFE